MKGGGKPNAFMLKAEGKIHFAGLPEKMGEKGLKKSFETAGQKRNQSSKGSNSASR